MESESNMSFRDRLALDRTYLARERTTLAYVRTGIAFIVVALFFYRFIELDSTYRTLLSLLLGLPGVYAVLYGIKHELAQRRSRRMFEEKYVVDADDGE